MFLDDKSLKLTANQIKNFNELGLYTVNDVLSYYPFRYEILNVQPFESWHEKDKVILEAEVISKVTTFRHGRLTTSRFEIMANDHVFKVTIFNRPWARNLKMNQIITISGIYQGNNAITALNYDTKKLNEHDAITPVYSLKSNMRQTYVRGAIKKVYESTKDTIKNCLPEVFMDKYHLIKRDKAIHDIHFPNSEYDIQQAIRALKYEEFLKFFTTIQLVKTEETDIIAKQPKEFDNNEIDNFIASLPFELTSGQNDTLKEILNDMASNKAMYRLIQGDVGCGKTIVAIIALYACYLSGYQGALLAPTEILVKQHYQTMQNVFANLNIRIAALYSGLSTQEKNSILEDIKNGNVDIVVGTHSLIQDDVTFHNLGFVVADEQQRFGVEQRKKLREKGTQVDFLLMSATPIPRTLASVLFGDMSVSTIETLPKGRKEVFTKYIKENSFRSVEKDIRDILEKGHQIYIICAAVDKNEDYDARNVYETASNIQKYFDTYHVGILHGKMQSDEKERIMQDFNDNKIQILVSTTVVEVGMNVVNAIGMVIYDADRFGLSQLHQLRGRVQRGNEQGYCWLLSHSKDEKVDARLNTLVKSTDGFEIAYEDLRLRGPGDILGTRQSGMPNFIIGNVVEDTNIIQEARKDAEYIISHRNDISFIDFIDTIREENSSNISYRN